MKHIQTIFFVFLCFGLSSGQDLGAIDSLKAKLHRAMEDSVKVHCLYYIAGAFYQYNNDSILFYTKKIEDIAHTSSNQDFQALANHHRSMILRGQSKYQESIQLSQANVQHYKRSGQEHKATASHFSLAMSYADLGDLEKERSSLFHRLG